ncbi:zinc ribbon domain-containing protein [Microcoleus anatoxicus]|uniref:Zinc ribbon domain-containing protein n=1 Tax=Microcoleus anatoxicus PTRS2 TaxID=2705321 RepID=A0ABU8YUS7_9CYAN
MRTGATARTTKKAAFYLTSQVCSDCGFKWGKLDLKIRSVQCHNCGTEHH